MAGKVLSLSLFTGLVLLLVALIAVAIVGRDNMLGLLFKPVERSEVDFSSLTLKPSPNQFLVCPFGYCRAKPHMISPEFDVPVETLQQRWMTIVRNQPRTEQQVQQNPDRQFDFIQRSAIFRFPDTITVRFLSLSENRSTLAIYSRSHYGRSDLGVNEKRIKSWLALLAQR